jgi:hypothetical protein
VSKQLGSDARSETVRRRECCLEQCQRRRKPIACAQCGRKRLTRLAHGAILGTMILRIIVHPCQLCTYREQPRSMQMICS